MSEINAKELRKLYDNFDTQDILRAIDMLDSARCHLADQSLNMPPKLRFDLFKLHDLAKEVIGYADNTNIKELFEIADDLEWNIEDAISSLKQVRKMLRTLTSLCPNSLYDD